MLSDVEHRAKTYFMLFAILFQKWVKVCDLFIQMMFYLSLLIGMYRA